MCSERAFQGLLRLRLVSELRIMELRSVPVRMNHDGSFRPEYRIPMCLRGSVSGPEIFKHPIDAYYLIMHSYFVFIPIYQHDDPPPSPLLGLKN